MKDQNVVWQVDVGGVIYEAAFSELGEWIYEGALQPGDKVRKGSLRWMEAARIPPLAAIFANKEQGIPLPEISEPATTSEATVNTSVSQPAATHVEKAAPVIHSAPNLSVAVRSIAPAAADLSATCKVHPDVPAFVVCKDCGSSWCKNCPNSYGGSVKICPECGAMCETLQKAASEKRSSAAREHAMTNGFGISDLGEAIAYPFKFKFSLIVGGVMFTIFSLGQSAAGFGGIFVLGAALFCVLLANMISFGVMANVVENFAKGNIGSDFMPSFDDFSLWEDVVHPFFLSIGAYLVSFGPFILTAAVGFYMVFSSLAAQANTYSQTITKVPGTEFYAPDRTAEQSEQVKELLAKVKEQNAERLSEQSAVEQGQNVATGQTSNQDIEKMLAEMREASTPPPAATQIMNVGAPVAVVGFIALLWGLFFMPAACAVAGYTRSFMATVNPLVGLDTIRRLGFDYVKVLFMCAFLIVIWVVVLFVAGMLLSPFNLPSMGNIPAKLISLFVGFYFTVVFSCVLGFALYKASDRLKLPR